MLPSLSSSFRFPILHSSPSTYCYYSPLTLTTLHSSRPPSFLRPPSLLPPPPTLSVAAKPDKSGEQKLVHEGMIIESLPNGMFRVRLDNEDLILGYISGRIRKNYVRILPGDRVRVEVSRYDSSKGRIVYRLRTGTPS
ncbi:hypothetical protein VNO77_37364 [Canavalia gladiata]|uniref:Translation initiation factor IF-1, chloroplastic n=1 Tax=Canavalia gladiata TaxID=3824 RepID=A0AAN9PW27_CANGL